LLGKIKKDEIEITTKGNEIILESGRAKAGLTLQQEIKLPLEEIGEQGKWEKLPEDFLKLMKFAMAACSHDMRKPALTCVHVNEDIIEASDAYRIARCQLEEKMPIKAFLIPVTSVAELIKLKPEMITEGEGWVHFQTDKGTIISCRVFEDKFPECEHLMDVEGVPITFPKTINEVLDRAAVFSKQDKPVDEHITITLKDKRLKVRSESDSGWFEEEINMKYDGDPVTFSIIPYLLKDILMEILTCTLGENRLKFEGENWEYLSMLRNE